MSDKNPKHPLKKKKANEFFVENLALKIKIIKI